MRRFYSAQLPTAADLIIELPADIKRHISTVLRQTPGYQFELFNGHGLIAHCQLEATGQQARVIKLEKQTPPNLPIELIQGLPKGDKLELVIQKGTELGLSRFILTPSERAIVKISRDKKEGRTERWQKIVTESCRQCGQPFAPEIIIADSLNVALNQASGELKLMLWEEATAPLTDLLPTRRPSSISLLVGPEGGFSAAEARQAQATGFKTVRLGPRILRTETAGLAILSILQYVYGDF